MVDIKRRSRGNGAATGAGVQGFREAPRALLFGYFGHGNLGNEATLTAFVANLKSRVPTVRMLCVTPRGSDLSNHDLPSVEMEPMEVRRRWTRWYRGPGARQIGSLIHRATEPARRWVAGRDLGGADALILVGTGLLDDYAQGPLDLPHDLLRWCVAAERNEVSVAFVSIGAEAIENRTIREYLRRAAQIASYRSFRDAPSRGNASDLGATAAEDPVVPDLAFSLPTSVLPDCHPIAWPPREIGVGVMGYYGWNLPSADREAAYQRYLAGIRRLVTWLLDQGHTVRLLVGDVRDDLRPAQDLLASFPNHALSGTGRLLWTLPRNFEDLLQQIARTDLVVGTRFHNVLFALMLERPAMSISYSSKSDTLLSEYGLASSPQHADSFDLDQFIDAFVDLTANPYDPTSAIRPKNALNRARLEEQYDHLCASVLARPGFRGHTALQLAGSL